MMDTLKVVTTHHCVIKQVQKKSLTKDTKQVSGIATPFKFTNMLGNLIL